MLAIVRNSVSRCAFVLCILSAAQSVSASESPWWATHAEPREALKNYDDIRITTVATDEGFVYEVSLWKKTFKNFNPWEHELICKDVESAPCRLHGLELTIDAKSKMLTVRKGRAFFRKASQSESNPVWHFSIAELLTNLGGVQ